MTISLLCNAQIIKGEWDKATNVYRNYGYGIIWAFGTLDWQEKECTTQSMLFLATVPEYFISVNLSYAGDFTNHDLWNEYDSYVKGFTEESLKQGYKIRGHKKCTFEGKEAIRIEMETDYLNKETKSEHDLTSICITYIVAHKNRQFIFQAQVLSKLKEVFDKRTDVTIDDFLFKGVGFID